MAVVVQLVKHRHREGNSEILAVLRHYVERAEKGELRALAVCIKDGADKEDIAIAGDYRTDPARGVAVAMRMSWRLTQMHDDQSE